METGSPEARLDREKLAVSGTDGIIPVVHHAQPGTESAEGLALLGSMAAPGRADRQGQQVPRNSV